MTTIKSELGKPRRDGQRKVSIIISHSGVRKRVPTDIYVSTDEVTRSGHISNPQKRLMIEEAVNSYREKVYRASLRLKDDGVSTMKLVENIKVSSRDELDFFEFAEQWLKGARLKYKEGHYSTLNSLERFLGKRKLPFGKITYAFLTEYCNSLSKYQRLPSKHLGNIRQIYREARLYYNTDTIVLIPNNPFERFRVPRDIPANKERSISIDLIGRIYNYHGTGLKMMARDCYILSFFLIGMNSADLYNAADLSGGYIRYKRTKTRTRRYDEAYIEIKVHESLLPLIRKYRGRTRVFNFSQKYVSSHNFNKAINNGLNRMCKELGIQQITFYSARHTWATIARNELGIDKGTISDALNHIDDSMSITDRYIKKDFTQLNNANFKVIEYMLDRIKNPLPPSQAEEE